LIEQCRKKLPTKKAPEYKKKKKVLPVSSLFRPIMGSGFMRRGTNRRNHSSVPPRPMATKFAYDPYSTLQPFHIVSTSPASIHTQNREVAKKMLPPKTLRLDLFGLVPFVPFPEHVYDRTRQRTEAPPLEQRPDTLLQLFFGQLPYKVSDHMIVWLCSLLAESEVLYIERVMQEKSRKGCMQVFVDEEDADFIITAINRRVLFDATGVWHAQNEDQVDILERHCNSESNRFKGFPFRMVVVEKSTSTYVRRPKQQPSTNGRRSRSVSPPPQTQLHERNDGEVVDVEEGETDVDGDVEMPPCYQYPPQYEEVVGSLPPDYSACTCGCQDQSPYSSFATQLPPPTYQMIYGEGCHYEGYEDDEDNEDLECYAMPPPPYYPAPAYDEEDYTAVYDSAQPEQYQW
jgi:hypothetical protein